MLIENINLDQVSDEQLEELLKQRQAKKTAELSNKRTAYEALKEETINSACGKAIALNQSLNLFKTEAFGEFETLYGMLQEYSSRHADGDGNFTVENKDATFKVSYSCQKLGYFDERSVQAEKHIIDFVNLQFAGDPATRKLVTLALERNAGKLDIKQVQKLYEMENDFDNDNWREGIRLLKESWTPSESKNYIRFYHKVNSEYRLINLNFASVK